MKIAILHERLEWTEKQFTKILKKKGHKIYLIDVRKNNEKDIINLKPDIVLNRIYASVANRDFKVIKKVLRIMKKLEKNNILCINSLKTSRADYSKYQAYKIMKKAGLRTPKTWTISTIEKAEKIADRIGFPLIVKRDSGGRGKDLAKVNNKKQLLSAIKKILKNKSYKGKIILQEFIEPKRNYDYRIAILNNKFLFGHKRSLVVTNKEEVPWLASVSLGSNLIKIEDPNFEEYQRAIQSSLKATKIIGAKINILDVLIEDNGPVIIESNPTPNFRPIYKDELGFDPVEKVVEGIIK